MIGIVGIEFNDDVTGEQIQDLINNLYFDNKPLIPGMWFLGIKDKNAIDEVRKDVENKYRCKEL